MDSSFVSSWLHLGLEPAEEATKLDRCGTKDSFKVLDRNLFRSSNIQALEDA